MRGEKQLCYANNAVALNLFSCQVLNEALTLLKKEEVQDRQRAYLKAEKHSFAVR